MPGGLAIEEKKAFVFEPLLTAFRADEFVEAAFSANPSKQESFRAEDRWRWVEVLVDGCDCQVTTMCRTDSGL